MLSVDPMMLLRREVNLSQSDCGSTSYKHGDQASWNGTMGGGSLDRGFDVYMDTILDFHYIEDSYEYPTCRVPLSHLITPAIRQRHHHD